MGYEVGSNLYRIWDPEKKCTHRLRDAVFDEEYHYTAITESTVVTLLPYKDSTLVNDALTSNTREVDPKTESVNWDDMADPEPPAPITSRPRALDPPKAEPPPLQRSNRPDRGQHPARNMMPIRTTGATGKPQSYQEAMDSPDRIEWERAR